MYCPRLSILPIVVGRYNKRAARTSSTICRRNCAAYGIACEERFEGRTKEELEVLAVQLTRRYEGG